MDGNAIETVEVFRTLGYRVTAELKLEKKEKMAYEVYYRLVEEFKPRFSKNNCSTTCVGHWEKVGIYRMEHHAKEKLKELKESWAMEDFMKNYNGRGI